MLPATGEANHAADTGLKGHLKVGFSISNQCTTLGWKTKPVAKFQDGLRIGFARMVVSTPDGRDAFAELMVIQEVFNAGLGVPR